MKKEIIFSLCCFFFAASLWAGSLNEGKTIKVNLLNRQLPVYEFVNAVPLETTPKALCGEVTNVKLTDGNIIVDSYAGNSSSFLVFNRNGKYVATVAPIGKGPNECLFLGHIVLASDHKSLLIKGQGNENILNYGLNGKYIGRVNVDWGHFMRLFHMSKDRLYAESELVEGLDNMLEVYNKQGKKVAETVPAYKGLSMVTNQPTTFTEYKNDLYYIPSYYPFVLKISGEQTERVFTFDFGKIFVDQAYILSHPRHSIFGENFEKILSFKFGRTEDFLRLTFFYQNATSDCYINLKNGKQYLDKRSELLPFNVSSNEEDLFVTIVDAFSYNHQDLYKDIRETVTVKDEDNPVVLFYRLKN